MKKILIVGANPYNANKGVAALAYASLDLLSKVLDEIGEKYEFFIYTHEYRQVYDKVEFPSGKVIEFKNIHPIRVNSLQSCLSALFSKWKLLNLRYFLECDYIFNIGAGDSFSDIYGEGHFNTVNYPNILARKLKKKILFLPQTYGPFNVKGKIWIEAVKSLKYSKCLYSRDIISSDFLKENLPFNVPLRQFIDLAFYLPYSKQSFHDGYVHVGFNISGLLWNGGYTKDNQFNLKGNYRTLVLDLINLFLKKDNVILHLIPHVVLPYSDVENDYECSLKIERLISNSRLLTAPYFFDPISAKSYISSLDFFLGSRMHSCIASFSAGVPVVMLAYSRKFQGLFSETLGYDYVCDLTQKDEKQIIASVDNFYLDKEEMKRKLNNINISNLQKMNIFFNDLKYFFLNGNFNS